MHFAAHSHHPWPDCTRQAVLQSWDDASQLLDRKWAKILGEVIPHAQSGIARILNLSNPESICFAGNTHELVYRLMSCLPQNRKPKILTTDGEFKSFDRQIRRLEEEDLLTVTRVNVEPYSQFIEKFVKVALESDYDMIYLSHVFFNASFYIKDLERLVKRIYHPNTILAIDGYHSFMALPFSLRSIENQIFFLGGGYKYAQAGEGVCFMTIPKHCNLRPRYTGWFAEITELNQTRKPLELIAYPNNGFRFAGATLDPTGFYRLNAVLDLFSRESISLSAIHDHVQSLQTSFLTLLSKRQLKTINLSHLVSPLDLEQCGHFLVFQTEHAGNLVERLAIDKITIDSRGNRARFGFGVYHDLSDVEKLLEALVRVESDLFSDPSLVNASTFEKAL